MDKEMNTVMAHLAMQGIRADLDQASGGSIVVVEMPNGDQYRFMGSRLIRLMAEGKLNVAGILEAIIARQRPRT